MMQCAVSAVKEGVRGRHGFPGAAVLTVCYFLFLALPGTNAAFFSDVHWTTAIKLSPYDSYKSVTLMSYEIPDQTVQSRWNFHSEKSSDDCAYSEVHMYLQHGSFPVINPFNESFPENFYLNRTDLHHVQIPINGKQLAVVMTTPLSGTWYLAAFLPKQKSDKISQKGFREKDCFYGLFVGLESQGIIEVQEGSLDQHYPIHLTPASTQALYRFNMPLGVFSYSVIVRNCSVVSTLIDSDSESSGNETVSSTDEGCPVRISVESGSFPSVVSTSTSCVNSTDSCQLIVASPKVEQWTYAVVMLEDVANISDVSLVLSFETSECKVYQFLVTDIVSRAINPQDHRNPGSTPYSLAANTNCVLIDDLGRFMLNEMNFNITFVVPDSSAFPSPVPANVLLVPDTTALVTSFRIREPRDIGGTLKVQIHIIGEPLDKRQEAVVWLCLMKQRVPSQHAVQACHTGVKLVVNTTGVTDDHMYIPFPEPGLWYVGFTSHCFSKTSGVTEPCLHYPKARFWVSLSGCVDNKCGEFGMCQEYISGTNIFTACECYLGWRGYGCTDGSEARSLAAERTGVLLLTLSNLFFIPAICLAAYRRYFVEAVVYFFTMFFSTFYHACDASKVLYYCMLKYDVLSYSDFYGAILSFWVTLLAMAEINDRFRSWCHMVGVLGLAVGVEYDRHGLWVFVVPAAVAALILIISWVRQCRLKRSCFPAKRRYLVSLLPGFILAGTGLIIFAFLETEENYEYTHSAWHTVISLSIVFLLPKRRRNKDETMFEDTEDLLGGMATQPDDTQTTDGSSRQPENLIL